MAATQYEIRELVKIYQGKKVLDIPSLTIKKEKFYGVMGPNGSGKTTLLLILSLLLRSPPRFCHHAVQQGA